MVSGADLRAGRRRRGWTQTKAAARFGVSQAYLSLLETGRRPVSSRLLARMRREFALGPTVLPFLDGLHGDPARLAAALSGLGYPGFAHVRPRRRLNPAQVLLLALQQDALEARTAAALPWIAAEFSGLDWDSLIACAKLGDCQNRLGFVVSLGRQVALRRHDEDAAATLGRVEQRLEFSRLAREDSLGQADMTDAERRWKRGRRSDDAQRWNLVSDLRLEHLPYAT
ncbi:MAG: helix-turn-helix transcriptional regulator [Vicinamibacterales bacterium]|nr:helix-turn-helix transcriptional regulator [Vicinamibacterales bacterium]